MVRGPNRFDAEGAERAEGTESVASTTKAPLATSQLKEGNDLGKPMRPEVISLQFNRLRVES
jgi:hypothetical protein